MYSEIQGKEIKWPARETLARGVYGVYMGCIWGVYGVYMGEG